MKTIFISGAHQGIGKALTEIYLERGDTVYGVGEAIDKTLLSHSGFIYLEIDYHAPELLQNSLHEFVARHTFDLVILAHETYGKICDISDQLLDDMRDAMNVNLWANKQIIDALVRNATVHQLVAIGANLDMFTHRGWNAYVLSKSAQHALLHFYAEGVPDTHFSTIIPHLTHTPELSRIFRTINTLRFPSVARIQSGLIKVPEKTAEELLDGFAQVLAYRSGDEYLLADLIK
jgi:NAD(P)-dependent dehydrogenase (short-subunit alcohol dehydrogenase family)